MNPLAPPGLVVWPVLALLLGGVEISLPPLDEVPPAIRAHLEQTVAELDELAASPPGPLAAPDAADRYGEAGRVFHAYGLLEPARACYERALELAPEAGRWLYHLALVSQAAGDLEQTESLLRQVLALDGDHAAAELRLGQVLLDQGRGAEAEALFRRVLEEDSSLPFALAGLGRALLLRGRPREAVEPLEEALARVPAAASLHHALGMAYRAFGDTELAREHLERAGPAAIGVPDPDRDALEALVRSPLPAYQRGLEAARAGLTREALRQLSRALELDPDHVPSRVNLATVLAQAGEPAAAVAHLERALALDPDHPLARFNLGLLLARHGDPEAAIPHLRAAVAAEPGDEEALLELGRALELAGRPAEALDEYEGLLAKDPRFLPARLGEARALAALGRHREALDRLRVAHGLAPEDPEVALALARLLAAGADPALRDGTRALGLARRLYEEQPSWRHAEAVALALAELDRCTDAERWQREALAGASGEGAPPEALEPLVAALGRYAAGGTCRPVPAGTVVPVPAPEDPP